MEAESLEYGALNNEVLAAVPIDSKRILDLGCGTGTLGQVLIKRQSALVIGVTCSEAEAVKARQRLTEVRIQDLNDFNPDGLGTFDCVICSHVLEHLYWPGLLLSRVRDILAPRGILVIGLPNCLVWRNRFRFLCGRFRYAEGGIMDRTHFRFYDWHSARELIVDAGYRLASSTAAGGFPLSRYLPCCGGFLDRSALKFFPGFFGWQFIMTATVP